MNEEQLKAWQRRADAARGEPMRIVTIHDADAAVLRTPARPVRHLNRRVRELLRRMRVTMYRHKGVGLAAPQVGVSQRIIVVDAGEQYCELVNPEIVVAEGTQDEPMEGCLSIPDVMGVVERAQRVQVRALDPAGREIRLDARGYFARVLQHEIDHLDGVLFIDKARRIVQAAPETKLKVVFLGSSAFGVRVLQALLDADVTPALVVTRPDRPAGRGLQLTPTPVKRAALQAELPVRTPVSARDPELAAELQALQPDVLVTAAYGQLVPEALLRLPPLGALNVHPSLLPRHRGPDPIRRALWLGDGVTGVTVLFMTKELDAGDILAQEAVPVEPEDDAASLGERLAQVGGRLLLQVLHQLATGKAQGRPQPAEGVSYAPKITAEEELVDWRLPAGTLAQRVRALAPSPGLRTPAGLKILRAIAVQGAAGDGAPSPGTVVRLDGEAIWVQTGEGLLGVRELQPAGGRRMAHDAYARGHRLQPGMSLG